MPSRILAIFWLLFFVPLLYVTAQASEGSLLEQAEIHLKKGRYVEAVETLDQHDSENAVTTQSAIIRSRGLRAQGQLQPAAAVLTQQLESGKDSPSAKLLAELAELEFFQGQYDIAQEHVSQGLKLDRDQPRARLIQAHLHRERGEIKAANYAYRWFVRFYNRTQPTDAETLSIVGIGSAEYARWNRSPQVFRFVVNTLCPDILKNDRLAWHSYALSGELLLEKYNRAQGIPELERGLAINPRAVSILVELGRAALAENNFEQAKQYVNKAIEVNPHDVATLQLQSDIHFVSGNITAALAILKSAEKIHPFHQGTLARIAACFLIQDGLPSKEQFEELITANDEDEDNNAEGENKPEKKTSQPEPSRFGSILSLLTARNKKPGDFFAVLGSSLEAQRRFQHAELCYLKAIVAVPELTTPQTALGMLYMRTGDAEMARHALDAAFKADPYHVRVSNMRKVLDVLEGYQPVSSENFVIYVDTSADSILAQYMSEYLEQVHGGLVEQFGFTPPERTRFEIYHNAKQTKAHQWFSARMAGLPWIQTIGASTGMMVALASPTAVDNQFNWARVLKHEYVHIITLQQTDFQIPHWYTEALAVTNEGYPRPERWNQLLAERYGKDELFNLSTINSGFQRPQSADDWLMAYCQSQLYAEYLMKNFGDDSLMKLLNAFRNHQSTERAIPKLFGLSVPAFEKGYVEMIEGIIAQLGEPIAFYSQSLDEMEKQYDSDPTNAEQAGLYAYKLYRSRKRKKGREIASKVSDQDNKQPWAALTLAEVAIRSQQLQQAVEYLKPAVDDNDSVDRRPLYVLARLYQQAENWDEARKLYERGHKRFPTNLKMAAGLATVYKELGDTKKQEHALAIMASIDGDDFETRKTLTKLASKRKDADAIIRWGMQALHIDVLDVDVHSMLATAYTQQKNWPLAERELKVALQLSPDDSALQLNLAQVHIQTDEKVRAKELLQEILKRESDNEQVQALLKQLNPSKESDKTK